MEEKAKEKQLRKLAEILRETFSDKELGEIKGFLKRIAEFLVEAYLDGDLPE